MASKEDLARIGREGFEIVDQFFEKKGRIPHASPKGSRICLYQYQPQKSQVYKLNPKEGMNTYEVKHYHDGGAVMDYNKRNSAPMYY